MEHSVLDLSSKLKQILWLPTINYLMLNGAAKE